MQDRQGPHSINAMFTYGKRLFQEWLVDQYSKMQGQRLGWMRRNQSTLRADVYRGLADMVANGDGDRPAASTGTRVILPSSFIGGPRHMAQLLQDAMAIVRKFGKPDFFITFTCNPNWPEIQSALRPGEQANDRPDIVTRVFQLKKKSLLHELTNKDKGILGKAVAHVHVVEWQKRCVISCLRGARPACLPAMMMDTNTEFTWPGDYLMPTSC
jgi:hypothetical protein